MGQLIIFFIILSLFIIPIGMGLIHIILLFTIKSELKKAGKNYFKMETIKNKKMQYIYIGFCIVFLTFSVIIGEWLIPMLGIGFILWYISYLIKNKKFGNITGIYENGIINDKHLIKWDEIHYYKINENNIICDIKGEESFDFNNLSNIDEIKLLFDRNNVKQRE
jgi:hypothetical protein